MVRKSDTFVICHYDSHRTWLTTAVSFEQAVNNVWWRIRQAEHIILDRNRMDGWLLSEELQARNGA